MDPQSLPNLFVPGAQKSGTSTLHEYLSRHPDIVMSATKEPHYFIRADKSIEHYGVLFSGAGGARYRGESSTAYMVSAEAVGRIAEFVPDPRFVFLFRNPVDRAWSHYWWATGTYGTRPLSFREAFLEDAARPEPASPWPWDFGYFHNGRYDVWLGAYRAAFGPQRVHAALFEDFVASPLATLNEICRFLDVKPFERIEPLQANRTVIMRFPRVRRVYTDVGRIGGRITRRALPARAQLGLMRLYNAGHEKLGQRLAAEDAPKLDAETRNWISSFYRDDIDALRATTDLRLEAWSPDFPTLAAVEP